jgi:hypothetical protein
VALTTPLPSRTVQTLVWRRLLLALCAAGAVLIGYEAWLEVNNGGFPGLATVPTAAPFVQAVTVARGSGPYQAGLRTGDLIVGRRLSAPERFRWFAGVVLAGASVALPVQRGENVRMVTLRAQLQPGGFDSYAEAYSVWIATLGDVWALLFAALIAWRRADSGEARILSLVLALNVIGIGLEPNNWLSPWPGLDAVLACFATPMIWASFALFVLYTMCFGRPPSRARRAFAWLAYASMALPALRGVLRIVGIWSGAFDPALLIWYTGWTGAAVRLVPWFLTLVCAALAIQQARGTERARVTWASASLGVWCVAGIIAFAAPAVAPNSTVAHQAALNLFNAVYFVAPLGLTYSLLYRRLLDISFAVNRAAVFSVVSVIVVGAFVLVEWLLGGWLHEASHAINIAVSALLALGLGFSVRFIHARVDRFVDNVFFRKRYENEQAIRKLAREAPYITETRTLLERTVSTLERHASASFVTLLLDDGKGRYGSYDENDSALVELRTFHEPLDLHSTQTQLPGEIAYPMAARGRLVGALVVGPKTSGETYAPDESDAIAQLAHAVGIALDALVLRSDQSRDGVLDGVRAMIAGLQIVSQKLDGIANAIGAQAGEARVGEPR